MKLSRASLSAYAGYVEDVYGLDSGLILTYDDKRRDEVAGHAINIIPAWEWLLVNDL